MDNDLITRKPAVAGMFYPSNANDLKAIISKIAKSERGKLKPELISDEIIGGVVPHAGYIYSGYEAFHFFELIRLKNLALETIVILNPDHQGYCSGYAASPHAFWETPLGRIKVDTELAQFFPVSEIAHRMEHSAEVMIPFIQEVMGGEYRILPISVGYPNPEMAIRLAELLHKAVTTTQRKVVIIASSDFSHYVDPSLGVKLDNIALEKIEAIDPSGLFDVVKKNRLTVCGFGPIMVLLSYSKLICHNPRISILARGNSGKHSPSDTVVDYISISLTK